MHTSATALLCGFMPWLSNSGRQLVEQLGQRPGALCTVDNILTDIGLDDRHELARRLQQDGLPQFAELRGWIQVIGWVHTFEVSHWTLSTIAKVVGKQPSALYRRVKQVTGMTWKRLVTNGVLWVVSAFLARCRIPKEYVARDARIIIAAGTGSRVDTPEPAGGLRAGRKRPEHLLGPGPTFA